MPAGWVVDQGGKQRGILPGCIINISGACRVYIFYIGILLIYVYIWYMMVIY